MVAGGAGAKDQRLKEKLKSRHERAEERRRKLQQAKENDDDTMMEAIYDTMQVKKAGVPHQDGWSRAACGWKWDRQGVWRVDPQRETLACRLCMIAVGRDSGEEQAPEAC
jgi:hypothetical protein